MLKLSKPPIAIYNASQPDPEPARRFVVPVTNPEADLTAVSKRVWELANASGSRVQFVGLCSDAARELEFRRLLATITAMVNYGSVSADSEIVMGKDWVKGIQSRVGKGDTLVCWAEPHRGLLHLDPGVPVYFIPEVKTRRVRQSNWLTRASAWIGSIAIIVVFFFIQVQTSRLINGWTTILQLLSVAGEFSFIWLWNSLLG
jgi:hypothetical protein